LNNLKNNQIRINKKAPACAGSQPGRQAGWLAGGVDLRSLY